MALTKHELKRYNDHLAQIQSQAGQLAVLMNSSYPVLNTPGTLPIHLLQKQLITIEKNFDSNLLIRWESINAHWQEIVDILNNTPGLKEDLGQKNPKIMLHLNNVDKEVQKLKQPLHLALKQYSNTFNLETFHLVPSDFEPRLSGQITASLSVLNSMDLSHPEIKYFHSYLTKRLSNDFDPTQKLQAIYTAQSVINDFLLKKEMGIDTITKSKLSKLNHILKNTTQTFSQDPKIRPLLNQIQGIQSSPAPKHILSPKTQIIVKTKEEEPDSKPSSFPHFNKKRKWDLSTVFARKLKSQFENTHWSVSKIDKNNYQISHDNHICSIEKINQSMVFSTSDLHPSTLNAMYKAMNAYKLAKPKHTFTCDITATSKENALKLIRKTEQMGLEVKHLSIIDPTGKKHEIPSEQIAQFIQQVKTSDPAQTISANKSSPPPIKKQRR